MSFVSVGFYIFILLFVLIYYIVPIKHRWTILLGASLLFYYTLDKQGFPRLLGTVIFSYMVAMLLAHCKKKGIKNKTQKLILVVSVVLVLLPLFVVKEGNFITTELLHGGVREYIVPIGISFYTLQIIGYLVDVYKGRTICQKNPAKYMLFVTYFPQIIQGPIPRYEKMKQLFVGHFFDEVAFSKGCHLIIWGFFLKMMIADKAAVVVDTVFLSFDIYKGWYILLAGILYSIQLYTDFQACVCIAKGVSALFGINLDDNFKHPYFSQSTKEFWSRWHISLSLWLRDYIYIPLGGNRKGAIRKWINLYIVFIVSGMWHGAGYKYIVWGIMHATYQLIGSITEPYRNRFYQCLHIEERSALQVFVKQCFTFLAVMFAWIIFRADTLQEGMDMIVSIFTVWNPWVIFSDQIFTLGLDWKDFVVLLISCIVLIRVSCLQEKGSVSDLILRQHLIVRWGIYIISIIGIMIFGTYGFGFNAQDFIYGGF